MELTLAENIRTFRKQHRLTQEQFAEILGVTTGAVYKWESGMSIPELRLIVEMADFFDISVDVLLGYRMKDNSKTAIMERIAGYCRSKDPEALVEAEKILKRYPNSFEVVYHCAEIYLIYGSGSHNKKEARRALELLEQARLLIAQNTDPTIGEQSIVSEMAGAYVLLGEPEKGLELLKQYNVSNFNSDSIGLILAAYLDRPKEAEPFLAESLLMGASTLLNSVMGYACIYFAEGKETKAQEVLQWGTDVLCGLKTEEGPDYLDQVLAELKAMTALTLLRTGKKEEARAVLEQVRQTVHRFDEAPDYGVKGIRFVRMAENASFHDLLGFTAQESLETLLRLLKDQELLKLWEEVNGDE